MGVKRIFLLLLLSGFWLSSAEIDAAQTPPVQTNARGESKVILFNIPAQPLDTALVAYSNVVGNQVIYNARLAAHRRSTSVIGLFTPDTALRALLEGTDFTIRYTSPTDVTLVARNDHAAVNMNPGADLGGAQGSLTLDTLYIELPAGAERRPDFTDYGQAVRLEIKRALARDSETSYRILNIQAEFRIDGSGHVENPHLKRRTGDRGLDAAVERVLRGIRLRSAPPKGMPQPVRVTIVGI
ncbi:TonB C-terminal domain-containing protein [Sphingomonas sp. QA11]|uniref:TonB C-terminal domain-containing protein n=1 Tax=Sphingomonas sp. QA11 TaxID=2950605 RepID=UPI00234B4CC8|nr:TonB C-terminal domain-containing protein [Sphingomonas sp. QA11]WCM25959.1 TonB C-terminal domain-containing protein [Sphingomonas sp. QA11]